MDCTRCRDVLSAYLDGEDSGSGTGPGECAGAPRSARSEHSRAHAHAHTDACAACTDWLTDAYRLRALVERGPEPRPEALSNLLRILGDRSHRAPDQADQADAPGQTGRGRPIANGG